MPDPVNDSELDALAARPVDPATPAPDVSDVAIGDDDAAPGRALPPMVS